MGPPPHLAARNCRHNCGQNSVLAHPAPPDRGPRRTLHRLAQRRTPALAATGPCGRRIRPGPPRARGEPRTLSAPARHRESAPHHPPYAPPGPDPANPPPHPCLDAPGQSAPANRTLRFFSHNPKNATFQSPRRRTPISLRYQNKNCHPWRTALKGLSLSTRISGGSPSTRSAMMLRKISSVPPAIRSPGENSSAS